MEAGSLRHRLTFDEPVVTQNATGEEEVTFTEAFTVWGAIEPLKGRERMIANQLLADADVRLRLRWSPQTARINSKWRVRRGTLIYNIMGTPAEVKTARREIEMLVSYGANEG